MIVKKLIKAGASNAVILPKHYMRHLKMKEKEEIKVVLYEEGIMIQKQPKKRGRPKKS